MFALISSVIKRLITAISTPFRMMIISVMRLFNVNILSAKLIQPLTKNIKKLMTLRPAESSDYVKIGRLLVFKQLFALIILALCAGIFIYFQMFASKVEEAPVTLTGISTNISFRYDDIAARDFTGLANIIAFDGSIAYTGEIVAGVAQGNGVLYDKNGAVVYEGSFANNRYNGHGIQYNADGRVKYEGEFADNLYHGAGRLFNDKGGLIYSGSFAVGLYEGAGELYDENGALLYDGRFNGGMKHGQGTMYFPGGTVHYTGDFFEGVFQGGGALYDESGRLIYTGAMRGGEINYRALVGATLADVEAAFHETPVIYFQVDGDSSFFYPVAGVAISVDSRIRVSEWEREREDASDGFYILPDETGEDNWEYGQETGNGLEADAAEYEDYGQETDDDWEEEDEGYDEPTDDIIRDWFDVSEPSAEQMSVSSLRLSVNGFAVQPVNWITIDPDSSQEPSENEDPYQPTPSRPEEPQVLRETEPAGQPLPDDSATVDATAPDTETGTRDELPDFVQRTRQLYFEIDRDVWQSEQDLDKTKVSVRKVTILGVGPMPDGGMAQIDDNGLPGVEDCVLIDHIRLQSPTAFADVAFEIDKQNRLFQRLWNINHADRIIRQAFMADNLIYRFSYQPDDTETPVYFSIEAQ